MTNSMYSTTNKYRAAAFHGLLQKKLSAGWVKLPYTEHLLRTSEEGDLRIDPHGYTRSHFDEVWQAAQDGNMQRRSRNPPYVWLDVSAQAALSWIMGEPLSELRAKPTATKPTAAKHSADDLLREELTKAGLEGRLQRGVLTTTGLSWNTIKPSYTVDVLRHYPLSQFRIMPIHTNSAAVLKKSSCDHAKVLEGAKPTDQAQATKPKKTYAVSYKASGRNWQHLTPVAASSHAEAMKKAATAYERYRRSRNLLEPHSLQIEVKVEA